MYPFRHVFFISLQPWRLIPDVPTFTVQLSFSSAIFMNGAIFTIFPAAAALTVITDQKGSGNSCFTQLYSFTTVIYSTHTAKYAACFAEMRKIYIPYLP